MKNTLSTYTVLNHFNEDKIITLAQDGNTEAFNPLIRKYQQRIYNLIYQRIHDHEAAEDLCQEVFLKAWQALPNFKRQSAFSSWLYQIAINCSIDSPPETKAANCFCMRRIISKHEIMVFK